MNRENARLTAGSLIGVRLIRRKGQHVPRFENSEFKPDTDGSGACHHHGVFDYADTVAVRLPTPILGDRQQVNLDLAVDLPATHETGYETQILRNDRSVCFAYDADRLCFSTLGLKIEWNGEYPLVYVEADEVEVSSCSGQ